MTQPADNDNQKEKEAGSNMHTVKSDVYISNRHSLAMVFIKSDPSLHSTIDLNAKIAKLA